MLLLGPAAADRAHPKSASPRRCRLAGGVRYSPAVETREGWLTAGRKKVATLVPLALPEWRAELPRRPSWRPPPRNAGPDAGRPRAAICIAPLWIDLSPARTRQPLTWRRLAVGESLHTSARPGGRLSRAVRPANWLVYRSLAPRGNRTVLGQNFSSEFVCCRMLKTGKIGGIIEIQ